MNFHIDQTPAPIAVDGSIQYSQQQQCLLLRSKSLNDICNDSQISAFASDRFINLHLNIANNNNINNGTTDAAFVAATAAANTCPFTATAACKELLMDQILAATTTATTPTCMPIDPYIYNQQQQQQQQQQQYQYQANVDIFPNALTGNCSAGGANGNNVYGNLPFDNSRNLNNSNINANNNQCSSRPATANVFNLCNPLAINLNGVTEQIGNLHL